MKTLNKNNIFIVGVDGGGTKTDVWVSDLDGKILSKFKKGPSNLRNVGIKKAVDIIGETISSAFQSGKLKGNITCLFIGIAALSEEFKNKEKEIEKEIRNHKKIKNILKGKIYLTNDQLIAFKSGTNEGEGIVAIAGTGCSVRGWKNNKEFKSNGWGWLADEGSAFWVGQKAYGLVSKIFDGRKKKSILYNLILKNTKVKNFLDLNEKIYKDSVIQNISFFSLMVSQAAEKNDKEALKILVDAGKEIALSVIIVAKKLGFKKEFPLVLVGGMFKSRTFLNSFKKEIKKENLNAIFIFPDKEPVYGAIKLALEKINKNDKS